MLTTATLVGVLVTIAQNTLGWRSIRDHKAEDAIVHAELRQRLGTLEVIGAIAHPHSVEGFKGNN